jgi:hypothetical protein
VHARAHDGAGGRGAEEDLAVGAAAGGEQLVEGLLAAIIAVLGVDDVAVLEPDVAGAGAGVDDQGLVARRDGDHLDVVEELDLDLVAEEALVGATGLDDLDQLAQVDRLLDDAHRAAALVLAAKLRAQRLADHHHRRRGVVAPHVLHQLGALAAGGVELAQDHVEGLTPQAFDRLAHAAGRRRRVSHLLQLPLDRRLQELVAHHDEGVNHQGRAVLRVLRHAASYLTPPPVATGLLQPRTGTPGLASGGSGTTWTIRHEWTRSFRRAGAVLPVFGWGRDATDDSATDQKIQLSACGLRADSNLFAVSCIHENSVIVQNDKNEHGHYNRRSFVKRPYNFGLSCPVVFSYSAAHAPRPRRLEPQRR